MTNKKKQDNGPPNLNLFNLKFEMFLSVHPLAHYGTMLAESCENLPAVTLQPWGSDGIIIFNRHLTSVGKENHKTNFGSGVYTDHCYYQLSLFFLLSFFDVFCF